MCIGAGNGLGVSFPPESLIDVAGTLPVAWQFHSQHPGFMVNIFNYNPTLEQNIAKFCFANSNLKQAFLICRQRGEKQSLDSVRVCSREAR